MEKENLNLVKKIRKVKVKTEKREVLQVKKKTDRSHRMEKTGLELKTLLDLVLQGKVKTMRVL